MQRKIQRSQKALHDLEELADFLRGISVEVAQRFVEASDKTFRFLAENREVGQQCSFADPRLSGMRVWQIQGFRNHLVYFRPTDDGIEIIRVLHGARDIDQLFSGIT